MYSVAFLLTTQFCYKLCTLSTLDIVPCCQDRQHCATLFGYCGCLEN